MIENLFGTGYASTTDSTDIKNTNVSPSSPTILPDTAFFLFISSLCRTACSGRHSRSSRPTTSRPESASPNEEELTSQEKYVKSLSDYKNLQEQSKRELHAAKSFAIQRFARDLLESIDNLARASSVVSEEVKQDAERHKAFADLLDDVDKVETQLLGTLRSHGMTIVDPHGHKFDPNVHEATFEMAFPGKEPGTVFHVEQKGYLLNGRVLRPAKVKYPTSLWMKIDCRLVL
jgi:molecular chaperone GrpE (heat shock protein)